MSCMLRVRPRLAYLLHVACHLCLIGMVHLEHCVEKDLKNMPRLNGKEVLGSISNVCSGYGRWKLGNDSHILAIFR